MMLIIPLYCEYDDIKHFQIIETSFKRFLRLFEIKRKCHKNLISDDWVVCKLKYFFNNLKCSEIF